jgi:hypothetical protein
MKQTSMQIPFDDTWEMMQVKHNKKTNVLEICVMFNNTWYLGMGYTVSSAMKQVEENIEKRVAFRAKFNLDENGRPLGENTKLEDLF